MLGLVQKRGKGTRTSFLPIEILLISETPCLSAHWNMHLLNRFYTCSLYSVIKTSGSGNPPFWNAGKAQISSGFLNWLMACCYFGDSSLLQHLLHFQLYQFFLIFVPFLWFLGETFTSVLVAEGSWTLLLRTRHFDLS